MVIEFDKKWVDRAWVQLHKALYALNDNDIEKVLNYVARALSNLQSGVYSSDGWDECLGDKLDYTASFLDDARGVLKEHGYKISEEGDENARED